MNHLTHDPSFIRVFAGEESSRVRRHQPVQQTTSFSQNSIFHDIVLTIYLTIVRLSCTSVECLSAMPDIPRRHSKKTASPFCKILWLVCLKLPEADGLNLYEASVTHREVAHFQLSKHRRGVQRQSAFAPPVRTAPPHFAGRHVHNSECVSSL